MLRNPLSTAFGTPGVLSAGTPGDAVPAHHMSCTEKRAGGGSSPQDTVTSVGDPRDAGGGLTWVASAKLSVRLSLRTHGVTDQECPNSSLCCCELSPAQGPGPPCHHCVTHHSPDHHGHPPHRDPHGHPSQPRSPESLTTSQIPTVTHHIPDPHGHSSHPRPPRSPITSQIPRVTHHILDSPPACTLDPPGHPWKSRHPLQCSPLPSPTAAPCCHPLQPTRAGGKH